MRQNLRIDQGHWALYPCKPVIVKELTHVFSHRKWFMKARGDLQHTTSIETIQKAINNNDDQTGGIADHAAWTPRVTDRIRSTVE